MEEYWAEAVQSYMNANLGKNSADGIHNPVNARAELEECDPALYQFIANFFRDINWTPTCPTLEGM